MAGVTGWHRVVERELLNNAELQPPIGSAKSPLITQRQETMPMRNILLMGIAATLFASASGAQTKRETNLSEMLETIRAKHKLPSLAAAVVVDGKVVATNAAGVRRYGTAVKVTPEDKFHIGSDTKSMTATVAGMLVEKGKISWTTTIAESFPEFVNNIHSDYRSATLEQLLANRGGVPGKPPSAVWMKAWQATGQPTVSATA